MDPISVRAVAANPHTPLKIHKSAGKCFKLFEVIKEDICFYISGESLECCLLTTGLLKTLISASSLFFQLGLVDRLDGKKFLLSNCD